MIFMTDSNIDDKYFKRLRDKLFSDFSEWDAEAFDIFPYPAGSGKSVKAKEYMAKIASTTGYKVLYVQLFTKDKALQKTVDEINDNAKKSTSVAMKWDSKDPTNKETMYAIRSIPILCITHQMYFQICQGKHKELIEGRDILIIDEFPEIVNPVMVTQEDLSKLFTFFRPYSQHEEMVKLGKELDQAFWDVYLPKYQSGKWEERITLLLMDETKKKEYAESIQKLIKEVKHQSKTIKPSYEDKIADANNDGEDDAQSHPLSKTLKLLDNIALILSNPSYFYQQRLYTYDHRFQLVRLKNNLILDANGRFELRYTLAEHIFNLKLVPLPPDYLTSRFTHIQVKTNVSAYRKNPDLHEKILNQIKFNEQDKVLIVTKQNYEKKVQDYIQKIQQENPTVTIQIDHFGNLLGKNDYKDYNVIVVMATPNFPYITYFINYLYFSQTTAKQQKNLKIFNDPDNPEVELLRHRTLAGEFYQAIRRINRNNAMAMNIYVATDNEKVIDFVTELFPKIQRDHSVSLSIKETQDKKKTKKAIQYEREAQTLLKILLEYRSRHYPSVSKYTARERMGFSKNDKDRNHFTRVIASAEKLLNQNNIFTYKHQFLLEINGSVDDI
jgi:hypothetical protein